MDLARYCAVCTGGMSGLQSMMRQFQQGAAGKGMGMNFGDG